jgi:hypothetical protein
MIPAAVKKIYETYIKEASGAKSAEVHRFGGIGRVLTGRPSLAESLVPAFDAALAGEFKSIYAQNPDSNDVRELSEWMLLQTEDYRSEPELRYAFMAALRHLAPLAVNLETSDAEYLTKLFESAFPKRERFPAITELIERMRERSLAK